MNIPELFNALKKTSKTTEKKNLLKTFGLTPELETLLKHALNYDIVFNLTSEAFMKDMSWWSGEVATADNTFPVEALPEIFNHQGTIAKCNFIQSKLKYKSKEVVELFAAVIDKDLGCGISVKTVNSVFKGLIKSFDIMLAEKQDKEMFDRAYADVDYVYVNLKIDGIRCMAFCNSKEDIQFYTRGGKDVNPFLVENIKKEIQDNYDYFHGKILDGEIYYSDFQNLMRVVNRKNITAHSISIRNECKYMVFDMISDILKLKPLNERIHLIENIPNMKYVVRMKYAKFNKDFQLLRKYADSVILKKHEGIIVKHPLGIYEDKRSQYWMKMKDTKGIELEILDVVEGTGKYVGMLGAVVLKLENASSVNCGTGFSDKERKELWEVREKLKGQMCEIEYMEETKDASLRHPRFIRLREDLKPITKENENA